MHGLDAAQRRLTVSNVSSTRSGTILARVETCMGVRVDVEEVKKKLGGA